MVTTMRLGHRQRRPGGHPRRRRPSATGADGRARPRPRQGRPRRGRPRRSSAATSGVAATDDIDAVLADRSAGRGVRGVRRHPSRRGPRRHRPGDRGRRRGRHPRPLRALRPAQRPAGDARPGAGRRSRRAAARCSSPASTRAGATTYCRCWSAASARTVDVDPLPGDLRLLHLRPAGLGPLPRRHGPADGLRAADARADRPDHGVGRPDAADGPGPRRRARRDPRDRRPARRSTTTVTTKAMGEFEAGTQGAVRFEVQGIVDGRAAHRHRARHPHPPVVRTGLADAARRRRRPPGHHRGPAPHRGHRRGHRRGRQPGGRRQRHRGRPAGRRHRLARRRRRPASTTPSTSRCARRPARLGQALGRKTVMNIDIPDGKDPIEYVWGEMVPGIGIAAAELLARGLRAHHARAARVRGRPAADRADQRLPLLPRLAHRARRREGRGGVRRRGRPSGAPPTPSTTAPGWPPSTPSGTPSTTTASTTSSGTG